MLDNFVEYSSTPTPPHSVEVEEAVLGAVIVNPDVLPEVRGIITRGDDFYDSKNKIIWDAVCRLDDKREPIDYLTIQEELERRNQLSEVGGPSRLTFLTNAAPLSFNAPYYAKIVHSHGIRRRMISAASQIAQTAYNEKEDIEDVVSKSLEAVQSVSNGLSGGRVQESAELASMFYDTVEQNSRRTELPGIPTGIVDLDIKLGGGLQNDDFILVAGFPGMGKTGFLDTIITHTSKAFWTGLFTLEMSSEQQINRIAAQMTGIDLQRIRNGRLKENEWPLVTNAVEEIEARKLWMDESPFLSFPSMRAKCVQMRAKGKLDLVVIDYAGLLDAPGTNYERACYLSRNLKLLAKELHIPIFAAHQLNRKAADQIRPTMHNLRDSGTWEQDSDIIFLIYENDDIIPDGSSPRTLEIAKQRNGPTGLLSMAMRMSTTKFETTERIKL